MIVIASFFVDEPMRRAMEKNINQRLTGYTAHIQKVDFHLIGLSVRFREPRGSPLPLAPKNPSV